MGRAVTQGQAEGWAELVARARAVRSRAYCPYSHFAVGVALETDQGEVYLGCNVENASYGLSRCAEQAAVLAMIAAGGRRIRRLVVSSAAAPPATPCGACRQILAEFGPDAEVLCVNLEGEGWRGRVADLLPHSFTLPAAPGM